MIQQATTTKKPHWFDSHQQELIQNINIRKKTEKKELKYERRALKILNKLPEELLQLCLEFLDDKFKKQIYITKVTNLLKKYVGTIENLNSTNYEDYPIYKLLENIPDKKLLKFIKCGTPSRYYQKIYNNSLFHSYKVENAFYKNLVDRYNDRRLSCHVCAWEITKLIRFAFKEIMIEGENLFNTDYKKYKEYDLHFKKYEKYTFRLLNSIVYLHNKYK
jgi:hypothetical protein